MKISVTYEDALYSLDISEDSEIEILKASLEFESGVPGSEFSIYYNGVSLKEMKKSLRYFGIKDGDVLVMTKRVPRPPPLERSSGGIICSVKSLCYSSIILTRLSQLLLAFPLRFIS